MRKKLDWIRGKARSLLVKIGWSLSPYHLDRADKLVAALVAVVFFALYLLTCDRQPNIAGDSPELIAGTYSLGILHPPGYPLYTLAGYMITHIPLGSIAFRLNCFSAVLHSLTLFLLFIIMMKITRRKAASLMAVSILGVSYLFWFYSLVAEVFPLNDLFAVLLILMSMLVRDRRLSGDQEGAERLFFLMTFVAGLSLTNHQIILLIFPTLILFSWHTFTGILRKPKRLLLALLVFLLGLVPYIYLPIRASQNPYMNFNDPSTFRNFFDVVTRKYYGTTRLWKGAAAVNRLDLIFDYIKTLNKEVSLFGILLGLAGMYQMARKRIGDFLPLITAFFLTGVLFPMTANVLVTDPFHISTIERFYILPTIIFVVFIAMGIGEILGWLGKVLAYREVRSKLEKGVVLLAALIIAFPFLFLAFDTMDDVNLRDDCFAESYINNLLGSVEEGSMVFTSGDPPIELMDEYHMVTNNYDGEIITVSYPFWGQLWYMDNFRVWHPNMNLPENPESLFYESDTFEEYRARLTYYTIINNPQVPAFYILVQDKELENYVQLLPHGMAYKLLPKDAQIDYGSYYGTLSDYWRNIDRRGLGYTQYSENRRELYMVTVFSNYAKHSGDLFMDTSKPAEAADLYRVALELYPTIETELKLADALLEQDMDNSAEILYRDAIDNTPPSEPILWQTVPALEALKKSEDSP